MIKDILTDIVVHTKGLGFLEMAKITGTDKETILESMAEDRSIILTAKTKNPISEFEGVFGMGNLDKLNLHLKSPEYKENAIIQVVTTKRNGDDVPTSLHFENESGDFINDYRFMATEIINEKIKSVKFKGANWDIEFQPSITAIQRLKLQAQVHSDESIFQVKLENKNLVFSFGDTSTHAGSFIFQNNPGGKLKNILGWPVQQVLAILSLSGDCMMRISDQGAMQITIDSGLAEYNYILPAHTK